MSVADTASVSLVLADYASAGDTGTKANILGAGWNVTVLLPTGATPPQAIVAFIDIGPEHYGEQIAVSLGLYDDGGQPVMMAAPAGPTAIRVQQLMIAEQPRVPGVVLPPEAPTRLQMVLNLQQGVPLPRPGLYKWRFEIDGNADKCWELPFCVVGPPPGPVVG